MRAIVIAFILGVVALIVYSKLSPNAPQVTPQTAPQVSTLDTLNRPIERPPVTPDIVKPQPPIPLNQRLAAKRLKRGQPVFIRIIKESSELEVWMDRKEGDGQARGMQEWVHLHTYPICRWSGALGPKMQEGDGQSPEGFYLVSKRSLNPNSNYHLSFNLNFPNTYDKAHGRTGSFLMVHGNCLSVGCYAMTDPGIEDIYSLVDAALKAGQPGVPTHVFPFRMTRENMTRHAGGGWDGFWSNLKQGWDLFEQTREPPKAYACGKRYAFGEAGENGNCKAIVGI
jgi:murein L,D-transpeptidase YafK